tara:strand:- start:439 stop:1401 length:963 start_codon:yes stop_codon:yes gene_type:complete
MKILVTGSAGFIGFHICKRLLDDKHQVVGIDNLNNYYDKKIKIDRNRILKKYDNYNFFKYDLRDYSKLNKLIKKLKIKIILHLAAQAGVRYSVESPEKYFDSNLKGFFNILELSRNNKIKHLIFASTSSVYGNSNKFPLKENDNSDFPMSFYAATKKSNEVMAHSYSNIYNLPCTALRFFTVYGPYGRPDMSLFKFTNSIYKNKKIDLFNSGNHFRDFTYIDDIINGIKLILNKPPKKDIPFDIYNLGKGSSVSLLKYLKEIEKNIGKKAKFNMLSLQKGDVHKTHSSIKKTYRFFGYKPKITIKTGVKKFIDWYFNYFK